jgi:leader peptidase (prepilin peptidase) / N-methyltransferase
VAAAVVAGGAVLAAELDPAVTVALWCTLGLAAASALVDLAERRLPNRLQLAILAVVGVAAALSSGPVGAVLGAVAGLLVAAAPLAAFRYGFGLGIGDVKFAAVLGAAIGLTAPMFGLVIVWAAATIAGVVARATARRVMPIGPCLAAGFAVACVALLGRPLLASIVAELLG